MDRTISWIVLWTAIGTLSAGSATAEIFRWTDASGREHFTTDLGRVPPAHRSAARAAAAKGAPGAGANLNVISSSTREAPRGEAAAAAAAPDRAGVDRAKPSDAANDAIAGHDEAWWRERTRSHLREIERLESMVERCAEVSAPIVDLHDGGRRMKRQHYERKMAAVDACGNSQVQLDVTRRQLENFQESARRQGVPPGWLR